MHEVGDGIYVSVLFFSFFHSTVWGLGKTYAESLVVEVGAVDKAEIEPALAPGVVVESRPFSLIIVERGSHEGTPKFRAMVDPSSHSHE